MKSLTLKRGIAALYQLYVEVMKGEHSEQTAVGKSIFCNHYRTGGGIKQAARACVDDIRVNYHFDLLDKVWYQPVLPTTSYMMNYSA